MKRGKVSDTSVVLTVVSMFQRGSESMSCIFDESCRSLASGREHFQSFESSESKN
jgi:hypothetical protein